MIPPAAAGPPGHVAIVHEDARLAEALAQVLRASGHRVSLPVPGRRIVDRVLEDSPDLLVVSHSLGDPPMAVVVRGVRRARAEELRILVLYGFDPHGVPADADDVLCVEPLHEAELQIRAARLLRDLGDQRALRKKTHDLLGLYKMSWSFSLVGGREALFGQIARHTAEMLRAERGLVLLYDPERKELRAEHAGYGLSDEQVSRIRYPARGEAAFRWNFRRNGALLSNEARTDPRLVPELVEQFQPRSLLLAPIVRGRTILGLLAAADRIGEQPFTDDDLGLLRALAGQTMIAVENLRLHEELRRANEQLQEYDRLKSEFVAIVAHDFRKPLMAIRGFAELVLEDPDLEQEARREFLKTVITESEQLAALANDTLLITQIETGQFRYDFREIDVGPFLLESIPLGMAEHSVQIDVPRGFPRIWADPDRLRQVLLNLVNNAVKYSPSGSSIEVRARRCGETQLEIEVVDSGIGIPQEQIGRLFQKFARVRTEEHMRVSGTGLGLYICRLIVEGHGGEIRVESEPGRGSRFLVRIPLDARVRTGPV